MVSTKKVCTHVQKQGIQAVAFDFDLCAYTLHTGGALEFAPDELVQNVKHVMDHLSEDFVLMVEQLLQRGVHVAIATYGDGIDNSVTDKRVVLGGEALIRPVLNSRLGSKLASQIPIFALNPDWRNTENVKYPDGKTWHLQEVCRHFGLQPPQVVLVDDTQKNVDLALGCGYHAVKVDPDVGFELEDLMGI